MYPMKLYLQFLKDGVRYWQEKLNVCYSAFSLVYSAPVATPIEATVISQSVPRQKVSTSRRKTAPSGGRLFAPDAGLLITI